MCELEIASDTFTNGATGYVVYNFLPRLSNCYLCF
jgi:hypothetical protein